MNHGIVSRTRGPGLLVAVSADVRSFENYDWHAAPRHYLEAVARVAGAAPVVVPALGEESLSTILERADGVLLTGSRSNIHPSRYGQAPTLGHEPFDEARDATALALALAALERGLPLFAVCRGMQELNVALGGSVATEIQNEAGRLDHRAPEADVQDDRFAPRHAVTPRPGGRLAAIVGEAPVMVNSLHRQAIDRLADTLQVEAEAEDGTVEAVSVRGATGFALGVQWHPEYWALGDPVSRRLFEAFGRALRGETTQPAAAE